MTTEDQLRELLSRAADLPDITVPPVGRLLARARRRRRANLAAFTAVTAAAAIAAAVGLSVRAGQPTTAIGTHSAPPAATLARYHWSGLPPSPLGHRSQAIVLWTGRELIELGGVARGSTARDGAAYVPATGRWTSIPAPRGNVGMANAVTAWTGRQLFVSNGQYASCPAARGGRATPAGCLPRAGLYDPVARQWTTTLLPSPLRGLMLQAAVWTGHRVVVAGVDQSHGRLAVAAFGPATGRWQMITPRLPAAHPPRVIAMVATPGRLIFWSLWDREVKTAGGGVIHSGVDVFAMNASGTWANVTGRWPQNWYVVNPVFTGQAILLSPGQGWCGLMCNPAPPIGGAHGYFADPATLARTPIPLGPLGKVNPALIWAGRSVVAVNLYAAITGPNGGRPQIHPGDLAAWDPATGWHQLPRIPGRPAVSALPLWTGSALLVLTDHGQLMSLHP